jgi:endogenous inhibitor of DNA gyrase (YacG/DUF329 family)
VTSPVEQIRVECPKCGTGYDDWYRPSINLNLEAWDADDLREASTATCPACGHEVELETLTVEGDVWRFQDEGVKKQLFVVAIAVVLFVSK